ncbi:DUF2922 domain-containing protein [Planomicrobium sp. YIM 101495]|uniref:DUF2922 domain-containing protein n=1 Tax=Planomicrobium sp. YIM 101495 TaxID=2665160 RepID=UPI0012B96FB4|nr:DUF2922 domain-containing protein [Planomicrobium sp. YIM 101495]MTD29892.1 DUF2922 family protein [Planomicrobium sp. YIM 101495]
MAKTLELIFQTSAGKDVTLTVEDPREDVTEAELAAGMAAVIAQGIFEVEGSLLATAKAARVIDRTVVDYAI